jgi:hypothetical protein
MSTVAWVESPLQLLGAAEWADAAGENVTIAGRLTAQMSETADELVARKAPFGLLEPYLGIPWKLLSQHQHWLVGDGFSGQFRMAAAVVRPRRITFLDDGANAIPFADTLLGRRAYARPGIHERGLTTVVAPFAFDVIHTRARQSQVELFTAFDLGGERVDRLHQIGIRTARHRFEWTRRTAPATNLGARRVLLGSAQPVDGRLDLTVYLTWVTAEAQIAPVAYLPHRREPDSQLRAIAAIPGVRVVETHLPAELVLAGATEPLEVLTLASSTTTTLPLVLEGSDSVLRARDPQERQRRRAVR